MALIFGSPKRQGAPKEDIKNDQRLKLAKDMYMAGKMKLMTTETIPGREIQSAFGLIVCRSYMFDNAFYALWHKPWTSMRMPSSATANPFHSIPKATNTIPATALPCV